MTKGVRLVLHLAAVSLLLVLLHTPESSAFVPSSSVTIQQRRNGLSVAIARLATNTHDRRVSRGAAFPTTRLFFFGRDNNSKKEEENEDKVESKPKEEEKKDEKFSFFGFLNRDRGDQKEATSDAHEDSSSSTSDATTTLTTATKDAPPQEQVPSKPPAPVVAQPPESPAQRAAKLRSEAERMRLEAERMDAELTLRKIARLEKELTAAKASGGDSTTVTEKKSSSKKDVSELQREIDALLNKVQGGGKTAGSSGAASATAAATATASRKVETASANATATSTKTDADIFGSPVIKPVWPEYVEPFDQEAYDKIYGSMKNLPQIFLGVAALSVNVKPSPDPETGKTVVNATELSVTLDKLRRLDFSFSNKPPPKFTKAQIAEEAAKLSSSAALKVEKSGTWLGGLENAATDDMELSEVFTEPRLLALRESEPEKFAQLYLEFEYYSNPDVDETSGELDSLITMASEQPLLNALLGGIVNGSLPTALDSAIDGMYPKCTTKKDAEQPTKQPTEAQVNQLITDILPKANFQASSKPEPVSGGYIIRGSTKFETGDEFIAKLDQVLERSSLKDKMTVLYAPDFSSFAEESDDFNPFEPEAPILYVVAPEICREPRPVQLSIVSGLGLATSWYLSIFPFLLNPAIATRVDEQLALADASMTPDLAFLTDLSLPLFTTFVGIQLVHEMAHLVVAGANNIKTSIPVFVPSIITGITSTVTTFKTPPKNKAAMFDFAVSGPLAGMIASSLALIVGSQLTAAADPALFPSMPLEILRQSTLGGGIIEGILGNDILSIPDGARGTAAVNAMTVPLHPVALAGYFGLVVNALAILPIGTTDGGRVALTLFGRRFGKVAIGSLFFVLLLFAGLVGGSDLFLFYFSFCIAFQTGNEVPARNEVDKLDIPRVFLATATYVVAALALIPF